MAISLHGFCRDHNLPKSTVYRKCQELGIDTSEGLTSEDCDCLRVEFGIENSAKPEMQFTKVEVETGNQQIMLPPPGLPQRFDLGICRKMEAIAFEDPLAIAQQFLAVADQIQGAMDNDLIQRESRLKQTQQAQKAIANKVSELRLETRFYTERARTLDTAISDETEALQEALGALQVLGKPTGNDAAAPPS
jgi:hypothetical protein